MRSSKAIHAVMCTLGLMLMSGCSSEEESTGCTPVAADSFPCTDPDQCLSVTATWCFPGATTCATSDVDLSLQHPNGVIIGVGTGEVASANGCVHDGDEQANVFDPDGDGNTGPFNENITCSPYDNGVPPDRIDSGSYTVEVGEPFTLLSTELVLVDVNVNGQVSCQVVTIDAGPVSVEAVYP